MSGRGWVRPCNRKHSSSVGCAASLPDDLAVRSLVRPRLALLGSGQPVVLLVGEGNDREAELAEHDGVLEDAGGADLVEGLLALEALDRLDADVGVLRDRWRRR